MEGLTAQQREDCQDIFSLLDRNGSGSLDIEELGSGLRGLGLNPTEAEIRALMKEADKDGSGELNFDEFVRLYKKCFAITVVTEEEVRTQFKRLDKNDDGTINAQELRELLITGDEPLTKAEANALIAEFDKNGDGVLDLEEFVNGLLAK